MLEFSLAMNHRYNYGIFTLHCDRSKRICVPFRL